jgi:hypothetical protein
MTELLAGFGTSRKAAGQPAETAEASPDTPVLITEQQVLFATAAALPLQPAKTGRRWVEMVRALRASVKAAVTSSDEARPSRQHYPARNDFLEDSRMSREMWRL